jgi:hypothetical protein
MSAHVGGREWNRLCTLKSALKAVRAALHTVEWLIRDIDFGQEVIEEIVGWGARLDALIENLDQQTDTIAEEEAKKPL